MLMSRFRECARMGVAPGHMHWACRLNGDKGGGDAPDYTPMAQASKESAEIMAKLGNAQLDETKRQYDQNTKIAAPVVAAQLGIMDQTQRQGADYYEYSKLFRPLEQSMLAEVSGLSAGDMAAINGAMAAERMGAQQRWDTDRQSQLSGLQKQYDSAIAEEAKLAQAAQAAQSAQSAAASTTPGKEYFLSPDGRLVAKEDIQSDIQKNPRYNAAGGDGGPYHQYATEDQYTPYNQQPASGGAQTTSQTSAQALRSAELQKQIDALKAKTFDPNTADTPLARQAATLKTIEGREQKQIAEQMLRDQILSMSDIKNQENLDAQDREVLTMARNQLYDRDKANIDEQIGTAIADQRTGYSQAMGQAARQGMRYGLTPAALASTAGALGLQQASNTAAAANTARNAGVDSYLQRVGVGRDLRQGDFNKNLGLKQTTRNMKIQDDSLSWAKSLDVTGMARGMPGASTGAYSVANQAGNSAVGNQMAPSNQLLSGMAQGSATIGQGQQMAIQGLGSVLNAQTSAYNNSQGGSGLGDIAAIVGAGAKAYTAFSDRRMKEGIEIVGKDEATGLNLYEFSYIGNPARFRGVMADEVEGVMPDAVTYNDLGFASVNYGMLGIEMEAV